MQALQITVDTVTSAEEFDLEYLRAQVRRCLRAQAPSQGSTLGDMQTKWAKGEQQLRSPSSTYTVKELQADGSYKDVEKRKPTHDQWATTTHAVGTRAPGFSRETIMERDFTKAKYVRAIALLPPNQIQSIQARYSPSRQVRREAQEKLSASVAKVFKTAETQKRARVLAMAVLTKRDGSRFLRESFGMSADEWDKSRVRRVLNDIRATLATLDVDALLAWSVECEKLD